MNKDTTKSIKSIEKNGYYFEGQTLGEGGWATLRVIVCDWKKYVMYHEGIEVINLNARDDETALIALKTKFHSEYVENCEVVEYIVTLRHIN